MAPSNLEEKGKGKTSRVFSFNEAEGAKRQTREQFPLLIRRCLKAEIRWGRKERRLKTLHYNLLTKKKGREDLRSDKYRYCQENQKAFRTSFDRLKRFSRASILLGTKTRL